ncbi:MAG: dTDP-4-dehydrorhamnose 3,5-epimerase [Acidobacteriota bacterium]|nr:MAG: dTDP-4-dehydrorhamnose 3,5-epimerase [Acidobacteriota bacterium]
MNFIQTDIPEVILIEPRIFRDDRGFFLESYHSQKYLEGGIVATFVQDNHSKSVRGTVRGLHAQLRQPQGKLIRVIEGEIYDIALDIRRGSEHFGHWVGAWLSAENFRQIYVPPGFAHGFCVTSDVAQVEYKCTDFYDQASEISIQWNDPDLAIDWPDEILAMPILSKKDMVAKPLRELMDVLPW